MHTPDRPGASVWREAGSERDSGPQGATGSQSPQVPRVRKGTAASPNILYSAWDSSFSGYADYWAVPQITPATLDGGAILVYVRENGFVFPVPVDNVNGSSFYVNDLIDPGLF